MFVVCVLKLSRLLQLNIIDREFGMPVPEMYVSVFDWRSLSTCSWQSRLERFSNMLTPHHPSFTIYANSSARKRHAPVASWGFRFSRLKPLTLC